MIFKQAYEKLTGIESDYSKVLGGDFKKMFLKSDTNQFVRVLEAERPALTAALLKVLAQDDATAKKVAEVIKSFTDEGKQRQIIMGMANASKVEQGIIDDAIESVLRAMSEMPKLKDLEGSFGDTIQALLKDDGGRKTLEDLAKNMRGDGAEENANKINALLIKTEYLEEFINTQIGSLGQYQDDKEDTIDVEPEDDEKANAEKHVKDFAEYLFKHVRNPENLKEVLGKRSTKDVNKLEKVFLDKLHQYFKSETGTFKDYNTWFEKRWDKGSHYTEPLRGVWEAWLKSEGGRAITRRHETLDAYRGSLLKKAKLKGTKIQKIFYTASRGDFPESPDEPQDEEEEGINPYDQPSHEDTAKEIVAKTEEVVNNLPDDLSSEEKVEQATEEVAQSIDISNLMSGTTSDDIESEADEVSIEDSEDGDIFIQTVDNLTSNIDEDSDENPWFEDSEEELGIDLEQTADDLFKFTNFDDESSDELSDFDGFITDLTGATTTPIDDIKETIEAIKGEDDGFELAIFVSDLEEKRKALTQTLKYGDNTVTGFAADGDKALMHTTNLGPNGTPVSRETSSNDWDIGRFKLEKKEETTQEQIANKLKPLIWETIRKNK